MRVKSAEKREKHRQDENIWPARPATALSEFYVFRRRAKM